jgi:sugar O-acyltransferase (sialic acid O-acetyltransferase NeuD family)
MTKRRLLVYGASGHGKVVADAGRSAGYALAGFIDDSSSKEGQEFFGAPVLTWEHLLDERRHWNEVVIALGIGDNTDRERCFSLVTSSGWEVVTVAHETSVIAPSARVGVGTVLMAGTVVNPDAVIDRGTILNTGSIVEHDNRIGRFVHLSPNVALGGHVTIGDRTHVGLGAVVLPGVEVGSDVRVGAGAVVTRQVGDGLTVVGVPARELPQSRGNRVTGRSRLR